MCLPPSPRLRTLSGIARRTASGLQCLLKGFFALRLHKNIAEVHDVSIDASRKLCYDVDKMAGEEKSGQTLPRKNGALKTPRSGQFQTAGATPPVEKKAVNAKQRVEYATQMKAN